MLLTRSPLDWGRSPSRVRLACVRHAASVDSEPGSNSQVEFLRERLGSQLRCTSVLCPPPPSLAVGLRRGRLPYCNGSPADTRRAGLPTIASFGLRLGHPSGRVHALSSFQRTPIPVRGTLRDYDAHDFSVNSFSSSLTSFPLTPSERVHALSSFQRTPIPVRGTLRDYDARDFSVNSFLQRPRLLGSSQECEGRNDFESVRVP